MKTYGFSRRNMVPVLQNTKTKVCPKCKSWFAARPRARICDGCRPSWQQINLPDYPQPLKPEKSKITRYSGRSETQKIAVQAARNDQLTGKSFGCTHPREQQADHLPSARRHPYTGIRPEESGYCDVACNCTCHVNTYNNIEI